MNLKKAKELRKMTSFIPGAQRNYAMTAKGTIVASDSRRVYQDVKRKLKRGGLA